MVMMANDDGKDDDDDCDGEVVDDGDRDDEKRININDV